MNCQLGPWGEVPAQIVSRFLQDSVLIPRADTSAALKDGVLPEVERILKEVHLLDARFGPDFQRSGSYIEGLKVSEPDEFDFLVPVNGLDEKIFGLGPSTVALQEVRPDGSFVPVFLPPCQKHQACATCGTGGKSSPTSLCSWRQDNVSDPQPSGEWLLNPRKVMSVFKQSVSEAIREKPGKVTVQRLQQETPAVTFSVPHEQMNISVDLVPIIKHPLVGWKIPSPRSEQSWPSPEKIHEIQIAGVDLVAKHHLYWRYSFSRVERLLLERIDEGGGHRRNSLRILKKIRVDLWKKKYPKALVSYHLKSVLFWACEVYPSSEHWEDLTESFKRLVDFLIFFLRDGRLPHYFLGSDVNLFKVDKSVLTEISQNVEKFRNSPEKYLQSSD
ncbi:hypothetical protein NDU88_000290 [Pleurodeles waltl]|uniref:Uncharacterized protein n=1 Tax=Pleurodeles waltl TaxID=8319 RepID=A0AAV7WIM0_PLEWA|nr:hypothetical protein NDU88_000290 [Pleurodeles waltl]